MPIQMKKQQKKQWPEQASTDSSILELDPDGMFVKCKHCRRSGQPVSIWCRNPFKLYRWDEHTLTRGHASAVAAVNGSAKTMLNWVQVLDKNRQEPSSSSSSSKRGIAETGVSEPSTSSKRNKPLLKCPGVMACDNELVGLYSTYGQEEEDVRISQCGGQYAVHASSCDGKGQLRTGKKWTGASCENCRKYKGASSLHSRIQRMSAVKDVLAILRKKEISEADYVKLGNFLKTTMESKVSPGKQALLEQVRGTRQFVSWRRGNTAALEESGLRPDDGPDEFMKQFVRLYKNSPHFKNSLLMGVVASVVARAGGKVNTKIAEDVMAFCRVLQCKSPKAYTVFKENLFGVSERHLRRVEAKERTSCAIDDESVAGRVNSWASALSERVGRKVVVSLSLDATKVPPREEVSSVFKIAVGGAAPNHILPIDSTRKPLLPEALATEVKCALLTTQDVASGLSPVAMIGARPQSTNQASQSYNELVVKAVTESQHLHLISGPQESGKTCVRFETSHPMGWYCNYAVVSH
eukprot:GHVU01114150.1.p1 GENE.GHVU01114150.1~~GHVU01114150.1.p1  ORF type:complete len:523 (+),score=61.62 GHVU01114150.1:181-1749(+)